MAFNIFIRLWNHHHYWIPEHFHHPQKKPYYSLAITPHFPLLLPPSPLQPGFYFQSLQICLFSYILYAITRQHTWWHLLLLSYGTLSSAVGGFPGCSVRDPVVSSHPFRNLQPHFCFLPYTDNHPLPDSIDFNQPLQHPPSSLLHRWIPCHS